MLRLARRNTGCGTPPLHHRNLRRQLNEMVMAYLRSPNNYPLKASHQLVNNLEIPACHLRLRRLRNQSANVKHRSSLSKSLLKMVRNQMQAPYIVHNQRHTPRTTKHSSVLRYLCLTSLAKSRHWRTEERTESMRSQRYGFDKAPRGSRQV